MGNIPKLNIGYFDSLIDDFGIWQHTDGKLPYRHHGYSLDDAARGLVACLTLGRLDLAEPLFNYLLSSRSGTDYFGFATDKREFIKFPASDDAKAQAIWAFGCAVHYKFRTEEAQNEIAIIRPSIASMPSLRGPVYALLGACYVDNQWARELACEVASLFDGLHDDWLWPENPMTYGLGIIPYSLLRYSVMTSDRRYDALALRILKFIEHVSTHGRPLGPVGNDDWYNKGQKVAPNYSQQPIDAAYMVWAWTSAYQVTGDKEHLARAQAWMDWFDGHNIAGAQMFDPRNNKAFDGIDSDGVNSDSGAETNICYLLSRRAIATGETF